MSLVLSCLDGKGNLDVGALFTSYGITILEFSHALVAQRKRTRCATHNIEALRQQNLLPL